MPSFLPQLSGLLENDLMKAGEEVVDDGEFPGAVPGAQIGHRPPDRFEQRHDLLFDPLRKRLDNDPPPVAWVLSTAHESGLLQPVDHTGNRPRGKPGPLRQFASGDGPGSHENVPAFVVREVHAEAVGDGLVEQDGRRGELTVFRAQGSNQLGAFLGIL